MRLRETYAEVNLHNLAHNLRFLKSKINAAQLFCPMVKADAYGHGDVAVCSALYEHGVKNVGVSLVEEGVHLKKAGIQQNVLAFTFFSEDAVDEIIKYRLTPVLGSWENITHLEKRLQSDANFPVHLEFDTGMNRLGFSAEDSKKVAAYFKKSTRFKVEGVCTHLLKGEDILDPSGRSQAQLRLFAIIKSDFLSFKSCFHFQNSSALMLNPDFGSGARPGIALYGAWSNGSGQNEVSYELNKSEALRPVMSLKSSLGVVRHVKKGESVSYSGTWIAKKDSDIGVVPIGYADGYSRHFSNRAELLFRGLRVPVVGTVCMDYIMIDLTDAQKDGRAKLGEELVLFGQQGSALLPVTELAGLVGTISYEVLTGLGKRIPRIYV